MDRGCDGRRAGCGALQRAADMLHAVRARLQRAEAGPHLPEEVALVAHGAGARSVPGTLIPCTFLKKWRWSHMCLVRAVCPAPSSHALQSKEQKLLRLAGACPHGLRPSRISCGGCKARQCDALPLVSSLGRATACLRAQRVCGERKAGKTSVAFVCVLSVILGNPQDW